MPITMALAINGAEGPSMSHILPEMIGPTTIPDPCTVRKRPHTVPFSPSGSIWEIIVSHVGKMHA